MKVCKVLHISDGDPQKLQNGNFLFVEEFTRAEDILKEYLNDGWEVKQIISQVMPGVVEMGKVPFYNAGIIAYLEKEQSDADT